MRRAPGRTRQRLAKKLQANFPDRNGIALTWLPENIHAAQGRYRSDVRMDCWRWEAFAYHFREDGTNFAAATVGCWYTMGEILKAKEIECDGFTAGEIYPKRGSNEQA